jgi:hypothetical protein
MTCVCTATPPAATIRKMNSPTPEASIALVEAIYALLDAPELKDAKLSESTDALIERVLEAADQLKIESKYPSRPEVIAELKAKFAEETHDQLVNLIAAMLKSFPNKVLYPTYDEIVETSQTQRTGVGI